jgi:hypothetical protein
MATADGTLTGVGSTPDDLAALDAALDIPAAAALLRLAEFTRETLHYGELVTLAEAARRLDRPESTIRNWPLPVYGRIGRAHLVGWGDAVEADWRNRQPRPRPRAYLTSADTSRLRSA